MVWVLWKSWGYNAKEKLGYGCVLNKGVYCVFHKLGVMLLKCKCSAEMASHIG